MGLFKNIRELQQLSAEVSKDFDPAAQMRAATAQMQQATAQSRSPRRPVPSPPRHRGGGSRHGTDGQLPADGRSGHPCDARRRRCVAGDGVDDRSRSAGRAPGGCSSRSPVRPCRPGNRRVRVKTLARAFGAGVSPLRSPSWAATLLAGSDLPEWTRRSGLPGRPFGVLVAVSVVMGVFGREFTLIVVGLCGVWAALSAVVIVRVVLDDTTDLLGALVFVLGACVAAFFVAWLGWFIGTIVCVSKGHFPSRPERDRLRTRRAGDGAGHPVRRPFSTNWRGVAAREPTVTARSMAIERRSTWHRPLAVVATDRQLVMAPDEPRGNSTARCCRSRRRAGQCLGSAASTGMAPRADHVESRRRHRHHRRRRKPAPARPRVRAQGAHEGQRDPDPVGGADAIRHWIRTHATTYH